MAPMLILNQDQTLGRHGAEQLVKVDRKIRRKITLPKVGDKRWDRRSSIMEHKINVGTNQTQNAIIAGNMIRVWTERTRSFSPGDNREDERNRVACSTPEGLDSDGDQGGKRTEKICAHWRICRSSKTMKRYSNRMVETREEDTYWISQRKKGRREEEDIEVLDEK